MTWTRWRTASTGRRVVLLRTQCGLRALVPTSMRFAWVVGSMADQGKRLVGRAGLEPATEGL